ncbi:unnamed protein product [Coccothraustes coccothraustes]
MICIRATPRRRDRSDPLPPHTVLYAGSLLYISGPAPSSPLPNGAAKPGTFTYPSLSVSAVGVAEPSPSVSARHRAGLECGGRKNHGEMQIRQVWAHLTRLSQGQHWCIAYKSIKKGSARKVFLLA